MMCFFCDARQRRPHRCQVQGAKRLQRIHAVLSKLALQIFCTMVRLSLLQHALLLEGDAGQRSADHTGVKCKVFESTAAHKPQVLGTTPVAKVIDHFVASSCASSGRQRPTAQTTPASSARCVTALQQTIPELTIPECYVTLLL